MTTPATTTGGKGFLPRLIPRVVFRQFIIGAILFGPADTVDFWQAWAYLALISLVPLSFIFYFSWRDPQLVERRMLHTEKVSEQKYIIALWRILSGVTLVWCGLDHKLGWTRERFGPVPLWLTLLALAVVLAGQILFLRVLQSNSFAASIIQTEAGQTIAADGPYRYVRHPMYAGALFVWLVTPLALGSYVVLPVSALIIPILAWRLLNEEKVLRRTCPATRNIVNARGIGWCRVFGEQQT